MEIDIKNLNIHLLNTRARKSSTKYIHALKNCNLKLKSGEFVGVLGPSGSGKTTLLKAVHGILAEDSKTSGEILINGKERSYETWQKISACVDQEDVGYGEFKVEYVLSQSGLFRLSNGEDKNCETSYEERVNERVNTIIKRLKLEKCRNTKLKYVSGGERKRVMIGIELMAKPKILFLDEPTSGLDSLTGLNVIKFIKEVSVKEKITVFCNIHSPTSKMFALMDRAVLLHNGKMVFNGRTEDTEDFFINLGIQKLDYDSYPEMLLELCSDEFDYEKYGIKPEKLYLENDIVQPVPRKIQKTKNDCYQDEKINFYHIWLLIKRNLKVLFTTRKSIIKTILVCSLYIGILLFLINFEFRAVTKKLEQEEKELKLVNKGKDFDIKLFKENIKSQKTDMRRLCCVLKNYLIIAFEIVYIPTIVYDLGWNVLRKEISSGSYSTTSLYISYFIVAMINSIPIHMILLVSQYFFCNYSFDIKMLLPSYSISVLIGVIIGLFIGSVSKTKLIYTALFCIFIFGIFFARLEVIFNFKLNHVYNDSSTKFTSRVGIFFDMISWIFPFFLFEDLLGYLSDLPLFEENQKNLKILVSAFGAKEQDSKDKKYLYLDEYVPTRLHWTIFLIMNLILWVLFSLYFNGKILAPNNRLKLQRK